MAKITDTTPRFISYLRVSTDKQGKSGLGLDAQREMIETHLRRVGGVLVTEPFIEVESGKRTDRPQLAAAIKACKKHKATLIIGKLDRLARNVAFIANLMESRVKFVACDLPEANDLTLHVMAAFAQHEAKMISERTKAALAAKKARGEALGHLPTLPLASERGVTTVKAEANQRAANVLPIITAIKATGITTLKGIAAELTARKVETPRGGHEWQATQVHRVLARAAH